MGLTEGVDVMITIGLWKFSFVLVVGLGIVGVRESEEKGKERDNEEPWGMHFSRSVRKAELSKARTRGGRGTEWDGSRTVPGTICRVRNIDAFQGREVV